MFRRVFQLLAFWVAAFALLLSAPARAGQHPLGRAAQPAAPALSAFSFEENRVKGEKVEVANYTYRAPLALPRLHLGKVPALSKPAVVSCEEADVEVGLTYFGKRYLVPQTGRWLSPDPLALHVPGKADLNLYAYVNGRVFVMVDPFGLDKTVTDQFRQGVAFGLGSAAGMVPLGGDALNVLFKSGILQMPSEYKQLVGLGLASTGTTMAIVGAGEMSGGAGVTLGSGGTLAVAGVPTMVYGAITTAGGMRNAQLGVQMAATNGSSDGGVKTKSEAPMTKASKPADAAKPAESAAKAEGGSANGASSGAKVKADGELRRPYIRKGVRQEVEAAAPRDAKGRPIDPNTRKPIEGKPDLGHKKGMEFRREKSSAEAEGMTQKQFNEKMNDPNKYQLEDPNSNRSHKYEQKP